MSGFDVWLGNNRGNIYSRTHWRLDPEDPSDARAYFDYSFYELAKYDLPSMIDYALATTGAATLSFIGHD